jgi:sulfoxide reductase heme-binding subunit YedZ
MTLVERIKGFPYTPLQIIMHLYAWSVLVELIFGLFTHQLTANPIQALEQRTGRHSLTLLTLSLACTPLNTLFGWRELLKRRRALGLYSVMYGTIHLMIFADLDNGLAWSSLIQTIIEKPYIIYGIINALILVPMAATSFDVWKARLGKNWKRLHQLVYFVGLIAVYHYALSKKGDIFHLRGDIGRPLTYGLIIIVLLILRLPFLRRFFSSLRTRISFLFSKANPQPRMDID